MTNRQLKKKIKNSIHIESKDFLNELLEYPMENKKKKSSFHWGPVHTVMVLPVLILVAFISKSVLDNSRTHFNTPYVEDEVKVNEIVYDAKKDIDSNIIIDDTRITVYAQDLNNIDEMFGVVFSNLLFQEYDNNVACYIITDTGQLLYCDIFLYNQDSNNPKIQIGIQKNGYPTFFDEVVNVWENQLHFDQFYISTINKTKLILVRDTKSQYKNFRTKFKKGNLGIAMSSYDIDEEEFIKILKIVIDSISQS